MSKTLESGSCPVASIGVTFCQMSITYESGKLMLCFYLFSQSVGYRFYKIRASMNYNVFLYGLSMMTSP